MAAIYRYVAADLLTNAIIAELPLEGVNFTRVISGVGNFSCATHLDNDLLDNETILQATEPARTAIYVYRDEAVVWGGIIWARWYQAQAKVLQFSAQTFESYLNKVVFFVTKAIKYDAPQCSILNDLWRRIQEDAGDIGVLPDEAPHEPCIPVTLNVNPGDFKYYSDYVDELMSREEAHDYTIECFDVGGQPTKQLLIGHRDLFTDVSVTNLILDYPGNVLSYYYTESGSKAIMRAYAIGDGDGASAPYATKTDFAAIAAGYPRLDHVEQHQGVTRQTTLQSHANAFAARYKVPVISYQFAIKPDEEPIFGSYPLGSAFRAEIEDARFPSGKTITGRTIGWEVDPPTSENVEELRLIFEEDDIGEV